MKNKRRIVRWIPHYDNGAVAARPCDCSAIRRDDRSTVNRDLFIKKYLRPARTAKIKTFQLHVIHFTGSRSRRRFHGFGEWFCGVHPATNAASSLLRRRCDRFAAAFQTKPNCRHLAEEW